MPRERKKVDSSISESLAENTANDSAEKADSVEKAEKKEIDTEKLDELVKMRSIKRANKKIIGKTGEIIEFDSEGKATVKKADAIHFLKIPDFELDE